MLLSSGGPARAAPATEARTPSETFERKPTIAACLKYVVSDLAARAKASPQDGPAQLLLVIDPTRSLVEEIKTVRDALESVWDQGPRGLEIGVYALGLNQYTAPSRTPRVAAGALSSLAFAPMDMPRSLLAGVRAAADTFADTDNQPKAMLLVTEDRGEAEDDVEATREAIFDCGAAFYCIAGEAAFERAWVQTYEARNLPNANLTERFNPHPRRVKAGALYYGSEVAFGLVPYQWEFQLAQTLFRWVRPPNYPVPSGFGYWSLATLCHTSGGRYFIFDFAAAALDPKGNKRRTTLFDFSRLGLLAPDLRPRKQVLKALSGNKWAATIVKIWEHLANEAVPVIQETPTLERRGGLVSRPARAVRSKQVPLAWRWYQDLEEIESAVAQARKRVSALDKALKWWAAANGRERPPREGVDPLAERVEANFQLLGCQLRKVRFHWGEIHAALKSIRPLDVTYRRVRLRHVPLAKGVRAPRMGVSLEDPRRKARFAELMLSLDRMAKRYAKTPWALMLSKGFVVTYRKDVHVIPRETPGKRDKPKPKPGKGGEGDKKPAPKPTPPPAPPPGPRPGSGSGGPVTGGG